MQDMTADRDFHQQYETLQAKWRQHAKNHKSHYLPYAPPRGKVDYVLVAEIPNVDVKKAEAENVEWGDYPLDEFEPPKSLYGSLNDLTLHYACRRYLCKAGETYYITDLGKAAIPASQVKSADKRREFDFWYPKFLEELALVAKPTGTIIPVGRTTYHFLSKKPNTDFGDRILANPILHWSKQLVAAAKMASSFFPNEWEQFQESVGVKEVLKTTQAAYREAGLSRYFKSIKPRLLKEFKERDKHYMFTWKKEMHIRRSLRRMPQG